MTTLHPTTVALLEAAEAWTTTATVLEAVGRWRDAGRPDLTTPTPDRLTELEARIQTLFELAGNRRQDSDDQLAQITELEARLGALTGRVAALGSDHCTLQANYETLALAMKASALAVEALSAPSATPTPDPPRFVPTEPGWYWMRLTDGQVAVRWYDASAFAKGLDGWLAPVAPYAPPSVTFSNVRAYDDKGNDISDRVEAVEGGFRIKAPARTEAPIEQVRAQMLARARGCFDYSGGYRSDPKLLEAFRHGIQTVINALSDPGSFQSRTLEAIGAESPTRTADEARAKPMRGDRWATRMGRKYTLTRPPAEGCSGWFACWEGMEEGYGFSPGFPDETYLGNFAHELEGP